MPVMEPRAAAGEDPVPPGWNSEGDQRTTAGATTAVAVSGGMTFADGTSEAKATLAMAKVLKDKSSWPGGMMYLMIRENDDVHRQCGS